MSDTSRGGEIKARRLALGIKSISKFAEEAGIDREALSKAERGIGSTATMERAEAWLSRMEDEGASPEVSPEPLRVTFHDVYGIGEIIVEGPADRVDEVVEAISKLLAQVRNPGS